MMYGLMVVWSQAKGCPKGKKKSRTEAIALTNGDKVVWSPTISLPEMEKITKKTICFYFIYLSIYLSKIN